jgi:hypothetical protein
MGKLTGIVTLREACEILRIKPSYGYKIWHSWRDQGVRVLKMKANSTPKFYLADLLKMMEKPK